MSVDIDWENLTTGPDGLELAESIRDFIHERFQQIELPRFIQSVQVHSFDFGEECPVVELKDICDPLPDFYEDDEDDKDDEEGDDVKSVGADAHDVQQEAASSYEDRHLEPQHPFPSAIPSLLHQPPPIDTRLSNMRQNFTLADQIASPVLSRSSTPGIPGGTSNMSYFHLPLSSGLAGTPSGLNGNQQVPHSWQNTPAQNWLVSSRQHSPHRMASNRTLGGHSYADPSTRPSIAKTYGSPDFHAHEARHDDGPTPQSPSRQECEPSPEDIQVVLHMSYSGSVHISLTVQILLDLPMPSFIGIPMKLNIVGICFDGVALIAYLRKRAHFCFLAQEDAVAMLGNEYSDQNLSVEAGNNFIENDSRQEGSFAAGGLFKDIRVESEIGQKESGKQVLKNVGKVEKFVLEQVRKIFEDEIVYPSYWTFLV